jgi:chemotaxis signal transduction protein
MRLEGTEIKEAPSMVTLGSNFITGICQFDDRIIIVLDLRKLLDQDETLIG